jgi:hypothetical protein
MVSNQLISLASREFHVRDRITIQQTVSNQLISLASREVLADWTRAKNMYCFQSINFPSE